MASGNQAQNMITCKVNFSTCYTIRLSRMARSDLIGRGCQLHADPFPLNFLWGLGQQY